MEIIFVGVLGGILLAGVLGRVIYVVVTRAVDNAIDWAIYNFGNDDAVTRLKSKRDGHRS